jgi:hypothetical protein
VLLEVRLGELHAYREEASSENDTHDFEGNLVLMLAPAARVEDICDVRAHDDAKRRSEDDFIDV